MLQKGSIQNTHAAGSFQSIACVVSLDLSSVSSKGIGVFQNLLEAQHCSLLPSWVVDIQGLQSWQRVTSTSVDTVFHAPKGFDPKVGTLV
jgi:hypothetical protein